MEKTAGVISGGRVLYLDMAKAFAIICVVLGHVIQYFDESHEMACVYDVIYSFHMPLFMTLSGFFISKSLDTRIDKVIFHKGRQLLLPVLSFSVLAFAVSFYFLVRSYDLKERFLWILSARRNFPSVCSISFSDIRKDMTSCTVSLFAMVID